MVESCNALKWADDRFHALMQTNPSDAIASVNFYGRLTTEMEMFVLDLDDPKYEDYLQEFWNENRAGVYFDGITLVGHSERMEREREDARIFFLSVEVHEYVHHLQFSGFVSAKLKELLPVWTEGFATYIQYEYEISVFRPGWYGPLGSYHLGWEYIEVALVRPSVRLNDLPSLTAFLDWQDITAALSGYTPTEIIYYWGAWFFRFLVEVHPTELMGLKEVLEGGKEADARIHDFMARLNDDWYDWDKTLATLSVADAPEPIIVRKGGGVEMYLDQLFRTINELTFEVSTIVGLSTNDNPWYYDTPPNVAVAGKRATIIPNSLGTWTFTITATNVDGESAQLPFTVVVERGLELTDLIVIRDPLSTIEGRTVVNLNHYFDSVESIAFTAESTDTEVAIVEVTMAGRLIVAPISPGTAQITVRATSGELRHEHTFTITVTEECPPWLCRDFLSGWRKAISL